MITGSSLGHHQAWFFGMRIRENSTQVRDAEAVRLQRTAHAAGRCSVERAVFQPFSRV
ncbi:hypothetical protein [Paraburkholderia sp.]|uniref:hypothetical protein n=1 Tax=Paraburkholderia sp. TaxID=1926495 RepID=UPI002580CAC3|nr:hypothetical protein [Paraburkholderia sp.]